LKTGSGSKVKSVPAKKYKITIADTSKTQNFHLRGPGVNKLTGIKGRSTVSWTVRLPSHEVIQRWLTDLSPATSTVWAT